MARLDEDSKSFAMLRPIGPKMMLAVGLVLFFAGPLASLAADEPARVKVVRMPDRGIQPQATIDMAGAIHLVYFQGDPAGGDVFYVHAGPGTTDFSDPIRVNSQPGSAVALGTIRGAQIALGRGGRVHVAWNGSQQARPENPIKGTPMLTTRSDEARAAFEPQRNLMRRTMNLDGGGTIAADGEGHVYVAWQATTPDAPPGESGRRVWIARSDDDGATFAPEEPAWSRPTGACPCCGTRALVDRRGALYILYRAATGGTDRDMTLLTSRDRGEHCNGIALQPWRVTTCPMSSESLAEGPGGVRAAWETQGQVVFARIDPETLQPSPPVSPPGAGSRKHPALAVNARGETILVWAENTGWQRGGSLAWRIFDANGKATRDQGRIEGGIPVWSLPTAVARTDGGFTIIH